MTVRLFSFLAGLFYLGMGILGFIPAVLTQPQNRVALATSGNFMQVHLLFNANLPVNGALNVFNIVIGAAGILSVVTYSTALLYARALCAMGFVMAFLGFLPGEIDTLWGTFPMSGMNEAIHILTCLMAFYFAFVAPLDRQVPSPLRGVSA